MIVKGDALATMTWFGHHNVDVMPMDDFIMQKAWRTGQQKTAPTKWLVVG